MPQDIRNEWVAGWVDRWFGPKGSHGHQKRRNFPAFRNLKALPATLMDKDKVGGGFSLVRRGLAILLFPGSLMLQRPAVLPVPLLPVLTHVNVVEVMTKWALDPVPIYHRPIYPSTRRPSTTTSLPVRLLGPTIL